MTPTQLLAFLGEKIAGIAGPGGAEVVWCAAQWKNFSREINVMLLDRWQDAPCDHAAEKYNAPDGAHCGLCMRLIQ